MRTLTLYLCDRCAAPVTDRKHLQLATLPLIKDDGQGRGCHVGKHEKHLCLSCCRQLGEWLAQGQAQPDLDNPPWLHQTLNTKTEETAV